MLQVCSGCFNVKNGRTLVYIVIVVWAVVLYLYTRTQTGLDNIQILYPHSRHETWYSKSDKVNDDQQYAYKCRDGYVTVTIEMDTFLPRNKKKCLIFYTECYPTNAHTGIDVLFLHSEEHTSQIWKDHKTLKFFAARGHRTLAIDMPNSGQSLKCDLMDDAEKQIKVLEGFLQTLRVEKHVVVSPSTSGEYSIPYMVAHSQNPSLKGFVAIAPKDYEIWRETEYAMFETPTCLLYGSNDKVGTRAAGRMSHMPNSAVFRIDNAGHHCNSDKPETFHEIVSHFLHAMT